MRHTETHLCDPESSNFTAVLCFLDGLTGFDSEHSITELLHCVADVVTRKVLELKQVIKGAAVCQSYARSNVNCSCFAPTL